MARAQQKTKAAAGFHEMAESEGLGQEADVGFELTDRQARQESRYGRQTERDTHTQTNTWMEK